MLVKPACQLQQKFIDFSFFILHNRLQVSIWRKTLPLVALRGLILPSTIPTMRRSAIPSTRKYPLPSQIRSIITRVYFLGHPCGWTSLSDMKCVRVYVCEPHEQRCKNLTACWVDKQPTPRISLSLIFHTKEHDQETCVLLFLRATTTWLVLWLQEPLFSSFPGRQKQSW